ncbi:Anaphase-promoting complex subunit 1 [Podila epigama]|nr:Anaphase-promoting complex subunit 1 [Podila epigama]
MSSPRGYDVELVVTRSRVTWVQGTVLRKVLNFNADDGAVIQALFVWFSENSNNRSEATWSVSGRSQPQERGHLGQDTKSISNPRPNQSHGSLSGINQQPRRQALVVILRGVAKIYFHNGETHSVYIPFRVHRAWAMDLGLLIEIPYDKSTDMPPFYSILDPFEEFKAVKMRAAPTPVARPNLLLPPLPENTEDHNTLKFLSCMDPLFSIAVTVDVVQRRFRIWKYVSAMPRPTAVDMEPNTYFMELGSDIRSPTADARVFAAHGLDGTCTLGIFSRTKKRVDCYRIEPDITLLWSKPAVDALSVQTTRINMLDILFLSPPKQGLGLMLWTGHGSELIPCQTAAGTIIQIKDQVQDRVTLVMEDGVILRAQFGFTTRSSLTRAVLDALSFALPRDFFVMLKHRFLLLQFSKKTSFASLRGASEWENLVTALLSFVSTKVSIPSTLAPISDWDIFLNSNMHQQLHSHPSFRGSTMTLPKPSHNPFTEPIERSAQLAEVFRNKSLPAQAHQLDPFLKYVILAIHLVHEDRQINLATCNEGDPLPLLLLLCRVAGWQTWIDFYARYDISARWITSLQDQPTNPLLDDIPEPPDLFKWISEVVSISSSSTKEPFPTLEWLQKQRDPSEAGHILMGELPCVHTRKVTQLYTTLMRDIDGDLAVVRALAGDAYSKTFLDQLPFGVSLPFREAIWRCRRNPSPDLGPKALSFIGRSDLAELKSVKKPGHYISLSSRRNLEAATPPLRDVHSICQDTINTGKEGELETSGTEITESEVTDLRFGADRRVVETQRMLQSSSVLEIPGPEEEEGVSEEEIKDLQQDLLRRLAQRTLALPTGRAILTFGTVSSNLPQKYPVPKITLSAKLLPTRTVTELDVNILGGEHMMDWPNFHNGVAAGLRISPNSTEVKGSWIIYNRPATMDSTHAGLLLALGLTGHLRVLSASQLYRYLTAEHDMTSTGLLLGLACAHRGTMDRTTTKQLALRIPGLLPPEAAALNLSLLDQISCVLGIGLLYMETSNRGMAEVMLSEIGRMPQGNEFQECHSLAAGFALGFVTLAQGNRQTELNDMKIVEVLMGHMPGSSYRSGVGRGSSGATVALGLMYLRTNDLLIAEKLRVPETLFDLDYFTPDALTLRVICRSLVLWDRIVPTEQWVLSQVPGYLRGNLNGPGLTETGRQSYYGILAGCCFAIGLRFAGSSNPTAYECIIYYVDMFRDLERNAVEDGSYEKSITKSAIRRCLDVSIVAAAMVVAGSGRVDLLRRLRQLHRKATGDVSYGNHMAYHMALGLLFVGGGGYTLGSSPSCVAALLCGLYPRFPTSPNDNRSHLQAFRHLWVLAVEPRCLVTRETRTGVCCSVPVRIHLKVAHYQSQVGLEQQNLVAQGLDPGSTSGPGLHPGASPDAGSSSRLIGFSEAVETGTGTGTGTGLGAVSQDGVYSRVMLKDEVLETMTPCLLPELELVSKIEVLGPRYWPITLDMVKDGQAGKARLWRILQARSMAVIRHLGHLSYADDPLGTRGILARPFPKILDGGGDMGEESMRRGPVIGGVTQHIEQMLWRQNQECRRYGGKPKDGYMGRIWEGGGSKGWSHDDGYDRSATFGQDFYEIFLQDPQVTAFANYLCRAHSGGGGGGGGGGAGEHLFGTGYDRDLVPVNETRDEARAVFFTEVLYECLTSDKVNALGVHVWLYDVANRLETMNELTMRTIWELRIVKGYYDTLQLRRAETDGQGHSRARVEDDGETLVRVSRIYELFAKITKHVEEAVPDTK